MPAYGRWKTVQATIRSKTISNGVVTGVPYPETSLTTNGGTFIYTPAYSVTAGNGNNGTIYLGTTGGGANSTVNETTRIPLAAGETFSFTGVAIGNLGPRDFILGTGYTYIHASATSQRAVLTYYKQV
jgi:hypothetical protein